MQLSHERGIVGKCADDIGMPWAQRLLPNLQSAKKDRFGILISATQVVSRAEVAQYTLNSELAAKDVYSKLDQKSVTAWLDLRNKAAHGHYADYTTEQVSLLLQSVRNFIARLPA